MNKYIKLSIKEAEKGMRSNDGGPFGAVIIKDDKVIGRGHNQVTSLNDPTAHAEIQAIRQACQNLNTFDLSGCQIYTNCQPCPMCLSAIYWSRIKEVFYGATAQDAADINFSDKDIYDFIKDESRGDLKLTQLDHQECLELFKEWEQKQDKIEY